MNNNCALPGCKKEVRSDFESDFCSKEHSFIDRHRYVGEDLKEYKVRRAEKRKIKKGKFA